MRGGRDTGKSEGQLYCGKARSTEQSHEKNSLKDKKAANKKQRRGGTEGQLGRGKQRNEKRSPKEDKEGDGKEHRRRQAEEAAKRRLNREEWKNVTSREKGTYVCSVLTPLSLSPQQAGNIASRAPRT